MRLFSALMIGFCALTVGAFLMAAPAVVEAKPPEWTSENRFRIVLEVDGRAKKCSYSPATVQVDLQKLLGDRGRLDEHTLEVVAFDKSGRPMPFDPDRSDTAQNELRDRARQH